MEDLTTGQRIAAKRKELGLSQIALGEHMGVSRQSISKWESDAALPEIDKLIALSKLFCVSVGWLLGVEDDPQTTGAAEAEFTDREWEIIDRLTQPAPQLPRWLLPLVSATAAVALVAAVLSGAALYQTNSRQKDLALLNQAIANLSIGAVPPAVELLKDYGFEAQPSGDLKECTFRFTATPAFYEEGSSAELMVTLGEEIVCQPKCRFNGAYYTAEFTVPAYQGYSASFCLTDKDGFTQVCRVYDPLLQQLMDKRQFGEASVKYGSAEYDNGTLSLRDLHFVINAPAVFRDTPDLWTKCDLVVLGGGQELGRTDVLNRSKYSKQVNFSTPSVDFYSKVQSIVIGDISGFTKLEMLLECELVTGVQIQVPIRTLDPTVWKTAP